MKTHIYISGSLADLISMARTFSTLHYPASGGYGATYIGINSVQFITVWNALDCTETRRMIFLK